jgi:hypothetical protein
MAEITLNDEFGQAIRDTIIEHKYCTNLEIGSWDGSGSTQCFIAGMNKLDKPKVLQCVEINHDRFKILVDTVKEEYVDRHLMSSVDKYTFLPKSFDDVWLSPYNKISLTYSRALVKSWFDHDVQHLPDIGFLTSEYVLPKYDAVLIDGSEFTGYSEFMLLKDKTTCFMLDDVFSAYKCNQIFHELIRNDSWSLIKSNQNLRNGYAIFINNGVKENYT